MESTEFLIVIVTAAVLFAGAFLVLAPLVRRLVNRSAAARQSRPLPDDWVTILEARVPYFATLDEDDRHQLLRHARGLLEGLTWEGSGGLNLTDHMKLVIAAQAALLTWKRTDMPYPRLRSVLVYPSTFRPPRRSSGITRGQTEHGEPMLGESWSDGTIILAWDEVVRGAALPYDGHNVVFHEFAHQLDTADELGDGIPLLDSTAATDAWQQTLVAAYHQFERDAASGAPLPLDEYALTNRAEFFAVATESFFERPAALKAAYPKLYAIMAGFYRQDPASEVRSEKREERSEK